MRRYSVTDVKKVLWNDVKIQFIFVERSRSNFCVHCIVTIAFIMTWPLCCEDLEVKGNRMGEARWGHLLNLWCQITHPHHWYIFSSGNQNVSHRLHLPLQPRLKAEWYFWDQQTLLCVQSQTFSQALWLNWYYIGSMRVKSSCGFFFSGSAWVQRGQRATRGQGSSRRRQHGTPGINIYATVLHHLCQAWGSTHPELYHLSLFAGAFGTEWGAWTCGKYFFIINIQHISYFKCLPIISGYLGSRAWGAYQELLVLRAHRDIM